MPAYPGSGGGSCTDPYAGGNGGGLVTILATNGTVTVNGTVTANGTTVNFRSGGGSGGGIYINCQTFAGTSNGLLSAVGGSPNAANGGGGGGGRIAVICTNMTGPSVQMTADRGLGLYNADLNTYGILNVNQAKKGTIYVSNFSSFWNQRIAVAGGKR